MPTLAEIMASPEALDKAAQDFADFHAAQTKCNEDMNQGISNDAEFIALVNRCGRDKTIDYKKFCEIGRDD